MTCGGSVVFSGYQPVSSTNKTDRHDITESGVKHHNPNPIRHNSVDSISPSRTRAADSPQCCRLVLHKTATRLYLHISKCVAVIHIKCTDCSNVCLMVFNATFNNISVVISWQSVLLVEETGVPGENHRPVASH